MRQMLRQSSYLQTRERLEEIVTQIKAKDIPLEKSLDLYEEALRLGASCAEMIDNTDFSSEELEGVADAADGEDAEGEGVAEAVAEDADGDDVDGQAEDGDGVDGEDGDGADGEDEVGDGTDDIYDDPDTQGIDSFDSQADTETGDSNAY